MEFENIRGRNIASFTTLSNKFESMERALELVLDETVRRRRFLEELLLYKLRAVPCSAISDSAHAPGSFLLLYKECDICWKSLWSLYKKYDVTGCAD